MPTTAKKAVTSSPTPIIQHKTGGGGVNNHQKQHKQHQHPNRGHGFGNNQNHIFTVFGADFESKKAAEKYRYLYQNQDETSRNLAAQYEFILQQNGYIVTTKPALKFTKTEWKM